MNDRKSLARVFRPGFGKAPHLAGRAKELATLDDYLLGFLLAGDPPPAAAVLIGPRGNGKTALLNEFAHRAQEKDVNVLPFAPPDQLRDGAAIGRWLLSGVKSSGLRKWLPNRFQAGASVSTSSASAHVAGEWKDGEGGKPGPVPDGLADALVSACADRPRVAVVDEAHTLKPEAARILLNITQGSNERGARFLLVLAGTPHLRDTLPEANASFWGRCEKIGVGRLSTEATRDALRTPLADHGVEFEEDAMELVVAESQSYPYFIQIWGKALCAELASNSGDRIDARTVEAARPAFETEKVSYYNERYEEMHKAGALPAAMRLAAEFRKSPLISLAEGVRIAGDCFDELKRLGFVWYPEGKDMYEPGIPSLAVYVFDRERRDRPKGRGGR